MIIFLLGLSIFVHISDAYVTHRVNAEDEPKSITMFINGQDNSDTRRHAAAQNRHATDDDRHETGYRTPRKRNAEDSVFEDLYNNAPESGKKRTHGDEMRKKSHKHKLSSNDVDLAKIINGVVNYFSKNPLVHSARSSSGDGETKIDLVKIVNGAFNYLASLNPKYRANSKRSSHLEPRPIELHSKDETSLLYEINTKKIVEDVTNILSSKNMKGYVDNIARKAATIYRAITEDE